MTKPTTPALAVIETWVRYTHLDKTHGYLPGIGNAQPAIFGLTKAQYTAIRSQMEQAAMKAAHELLAAPAVAAAVTRLPFQAGQTILAVGDSLTDDWYLAGSSGDTFAPGQRVRQATYGTLSHTREGISTMPIGFGQVVIDSQRADDIAGFWSELLERPVNEGANQFFAMIPASEDRSFPALMFLAVPEPRQVKNRMHLDLVATDLAAEAERAVALGATKVAEFDEYGTKWVSLTDPEGNVFDIGLAHSGE